MEEQIIQFLTNPNLIPAPYSQIVFGLRVFFIILTIALSGLIIYILASTTWLKFRVIEDISEFMKSQPYGSDKYIKEWKKIMKRLDSGIEAEYKLAIIETDALLGEVLQRMGYSEETLEKNLNKITPVEISNIDELKEIRKVRNAVVYDPDYQLSKDKARDVMEVYQKSFRVLGIV